MHESAAESKSVRFVLTAEPRRRAPHFTVRIVALPENTKVYVVIPDVETAPPAHIYSPRLAHPEQAPDFVKQVIEVTADAEL